MFNCLQFNYETYCSDMILYDREGAPLSKFIAMRKTLEILS